jgi:hypothetical protein
MGFLRLRAFAGIIEERLGDKDGFSGTGLDVRGLLPQDVIQPMDKNIPVNVCHDGVPCCIESAMMLLCRREILQEYSECVPFRFEGSADRSENPELGNDLHKVSNKAERSARAKSLTAGLHSCGQYLLLWQRSLF